MGSCWCNWLVPALDSGEMKMILVKTNTGYVDYCEQGIETDIKDSNGRVLKTGDIVKVYDSQRLRFDPEYALVSTNMVVFDQFKKFGFDDNFFICGWKNSSIGGWKETDYVVIFEQDETSVDYDMYKIV